MSLNTGFGEVRNVLIEDSEHAKRLKSATPILIKDTLDILFEFGDPKNPKYDPAYKLKSYSTTYTLDMKNSLET